ncbi:MAG: posphoenolpyruvate synthetase regulatory kinase/phosphorylase PpsR [Gammaproteobacteria bacterium]
MTRRTVFFVSDQTGVTAETLGHSLLTQFDSHDFDRVTLPFVDSIDKAHDVVARINSTAADQGAPPIVFSTLVQDEFREPFRQVSGLFLDFFATFLAPLERELQEASSHAVGRAHGMHDLGAYDQRIEATNFALNYDDGSRTRDYERADVILIGVSRSGKTPTCLYLALSYGIFAANYPLADDELDTGKLPDILSGYRDKLFGLTIAPDRLRQIRKERRSVGRYATAQQVNFELRAAEGLYKRYQVPYIDTTQLSIEEIASTILDRTGIERRTRQL